MQTDTLTSNESTPMKTIHTVDEVFGITRDLPLNYVNREAVDDKLLSELGAGRHIVIFGSSKQGKTCLRKHCLPDESYILVQCSNRSDLADLHANILKRAGFELTQATTRSASGKNKLVAKFKAALAGLGMELEGEKETTHTMTHTTTPLEIDPEDVNDVIAALKSINFTKYIVLEDFHYLPYETQRDFSVALKAFHETSKITFVIVGVWLEDNRLIVFNGDLTGRVISVNADKWIEADLRKVIADGASLLGVSFDDLFINQLIENSRESVYLVQEACRQTCIRANIKNTVMDNPQIGVGTDVPTLIKNIVDQQSARYQSFLTNFADGFQATELEMHRWLLYPILTASPEALESGLRYRDIKEIMYQCHPRKEALNVGNLTQSLQSAASLQSKKDIMPIIIDYDQTNKKLNIVDKGFVIWLQHQSSQELLEDLDIAMP